MRPVCATLSLLATLLAGPSLACDYPGGPPGTEPVTAEGKGVVWAYYSNATDRYRHGVLGDAWEAGALRTMIADRMTIGPCETSVVLGENAVFEDTNPRITDVTGDGFNDVVVVETDIAEGAQLAVYGAAGPTLVKIAATPHIGRPNRWLAPAGIADFDGDGVKDVAYVETPHIGGTLRIWSFRDGVAREIAAAPGYSNHRIGQDFITGGMCDCGNGPELVLPDAAWRQTLLAWLGGGVIELAVLADNTRPETIARALECS